MPFWQWSPLVWLQYTHMGLSSLTSIVNLVVEASSADSAGTKPEKKPSASGWQGSLKLDWTTEWFCGNVSWDIL